MIVRDVQDVQDWSVDSSFGSFCPERIVDHRVEVALGVLGILGVALIVTFLIQ